MLVFNINELFLENDAVFGSGLEVSRMELD